MEHWEFLLQKEGDRSWLPLDSPDVEILEGRYRIVARSNTVNAAIDIRIAHLATEEVPPKRRVQKRSCRTNHDGLMVVIPFTHLEPGLWELCCSPTDLMSDLMAGAQPYAVKLQVVARESEEDWDPDWTSPANLSAETDALPQAWNQVSEPTSETTLQPVTAVNRLAETTPSALPPTEPLPHLIEPASDRRVDLPPEVAEILGASMDRLFQIAEQLSEQLVDEVLQDFDLTAIADAPASEGTVETAEGTTEPPTAATSTHHSDESGASRLPPGHTLAAGEAFALMLNQTALVAARKEVLTLSGRVAIVAATSTQQSNTPSPTAASIAATPLPQEDMADPWESNAALTLAGASAQELQLCLRDPQSLQILVSDRQPLTQDSLPSSFSFSFSLPDAFATHLVLGEVLLCGTLAGQPDASIALTTQAFSITVDPSALVGELAKLNEALTTEIEDEERIDLPLELTSRLQEQATPPLNLSFLDLAVVEPPVERSPRFASLAGQPLPPQLHRPDPNQARPKPLDLPAFKLNVVPAAQAEATTHSEPSTAEPIATPPPEPDLSASSSEVVQTPPDEANQAVEAILPEAPASGASSDVTVASVAIASVASDRANADRTDKTLLDLPSPTHMAFQSLKLQDRFLTRLTSLATDTELSALLRANVAPGEPLTDASPAPSVADVRSLTEEIVVDDEPLSTHDRRRTRQKPTIKPLASDELPNPLALPADDPVPMPALEVTTGELTAGKPINIRVKLPSLLPRIYVKLWVTDRQTRSLLDGPRWLVDFLPNGLGDLETLFPLTVPFGSVEIRFEAIAVEMHTQRESHKVTIDRIVVPPDLPLVSLDDFSV